MPSRKRSSRPTPRSRGSATARRSGRGCSASSPTRRAIGGGRRIGGPVSRSGPPPLDPRDELAPSPKSAVLADETRGQLLAALGRAARRGARGDRRPLLPRTVRGRDRRVAVDPGRDRQIADVAGARTSARRARRARGRSARWLTSRCALRSDGDLEAALRAFGEGVAWPEATSTTGGGDVAAAVRRTDRVLATDRRAGTAALELVAGPTGPWLPPS